MILQVAKGLVGVLPVILFLSALIYLDSYKLVRLRLVVATIGAGAVIAGVGYLITAYLTKRYPIDLVPYSRYVSPFLEESLKAIVVVALLRTNRAGFLVDAAILGFATGTGFALIENIWYLKILPEDVGLGLWIVRGFGTAIMHGGATAIFGMGAKALGEDHAAYNPLVYLPGWIVAVVLHSGFNHFFLSPIGSTLGILIVLPPLIATVFRRSEKALRSWLNVGFDADSELLHLIEAGELSESRVGRYLQSLKERFRGEVVADLLCYLRLHVELSLRAKGLLLMRESGFVPEADPEVRAKFEELKYLEGSIGRTGRLALEPFLYLHPKDLWQLYMLGREQG